MIGSGVLEPNSVSSEAQPLGLRLKAQASHRRQPRAEVSRCSSVNAQACHWRSVASFRKHLCASLNAERVGVRSGDIGFCGRSHRVADAAPRASDRGRFAPNQSLNSSLSKSILLEVVRKKTSGSSRWCAIHVKHVSRFRLHRTQSHHLLKPLDSSERWLHHRRQKQ